MNLPIVFENRMKDYFKSSDVTSEGFFESFDKEPLKGIRINRMKVESFDQVLAALGMENDPVTWCDGGFYTTTESSGKDPYYHAGVYYPQEPSAMLPAQVLAAKPGDMVFVISRERVSPMPLSLTRHLSTSARGSTPFSIRY